MRMIGQADMFKGCFTALVTPMRGGEVDEEAFRRLVDWQIEQGVHGLVPCGTTGESPTLSHEEHKSVVSLCVEQAAGRVPVMAGAGSNSTYEAMELLTHAEKIGADAALVVTPYYNKPSQHGLKAHYMFLAQGCELPIFIYNIPGRSVIDMSPEVMGELSRHANIAGVKDATAKLDRVTRQRNFCGKEFIQFSGEDGTSLAFNALGGKGVISVTSNVAPSLVARVQQLCLDEDYELAREKNDVLLALHDVMFCEPSPAPAKYALSLLGLCSDEVRLPLTALSSAGRERVEQALRDLELIS